MPFDLKPTIKPDLSTPTLEGLAYILRHKEEWPRGFKWDYENCAQCAMGMTVEIWQKQKYSYHTAYMTQYFNLPDCVAEQIFIDLAKTDDEYDSITPEHVATAIEKFLTTGEI